MKLKIRIRRVAALAVTALALGLGALAAAPAQAQTVPAPLQTSAETFVGTFYICDGNGAGSCKSLQPGASISDNEKIYAIGESNGAWRWDVYSVSAGGETNYIFVLHADNGFCNGNSAGGDILKDCSSAASEQWVYTTSHLLVNVGRSNDKGTVEVLCNPGGGGQLVIVPPGSCTAYHETWGFEAA
ncbi:MAG TPA: hypothetical protein VGM10_23410 [Actinocrinis sp.]